MSAKYGRHDRAMCTVSDCECEHQGALRDTTEPAYKVAKPWLMVLDNLFMHS